MGEKTESFVNDHPNLVVGLADGIGLLIAVPVCYACYKLQAKMIGKEVAKLLK